MDTTPLILGIRRYDVVRDAQSIQFLSSVVVQFSVNQQHFASTPPLEHHHSFGHFADSDGPVQVLIPPPLQPLPPSVQTSAPPLQPLNGGDNDSKSNVHEMHEM